MKRCWCQSHGTMEVTESYLMTDFGVQQEHKMKTWYLVHSSHDGSLHLQRSPVGKEVTWRLATPESELVALADGVGADEHCTSVTHLEQAISLETYKDISRLIGPSAIFFFAFGRIYIFALDRKCLTLNIVTRYIWVDILCWNIS